MEQINTSSTKKREAKENDKVSKGDVKNKKKCNKPKVPKDLNEQALSILMDISEGFRATFNRIKDHPKLKEPPMNEYELYDIKSALSNEKSKI